jgi:uncharacterized membrane protein YgdD (TMEM256/DUF423 family)
MERRFLAIGAVLGAVGVTAGAFGAHGLKSMVGADDLALFETGVRYHLVHALAVVLVGLVARRIPGRLVGAAGWLLVAGVAIFSGTLYVMALGGPRWLGAITPIGGTALIVGWALLAVAAWRR